MSWPFTASKSVFRRIRNIWGLARRMGGLCISPIQPHFCFCRDLLWETRTLFLISHRTGSQPEWGDLPIQLHYLELASLYQGGYFQLRWKERFLCSRFRAVVLECFNKSFHKGFRMFSFPLSTQYHFSLGKKALKIIPFRL